MNNTEKKQSIKEYIILRELELNSYQNIDITAEGYQVLYTLKDKYKDTTTADILKTNR